MYIERRNVGMVKVGPDCQSNTVRVQHMTSTHVCSTGAQYILHVSHHLQQNMYRLPLTSSGNTVESQDTLNSGHLCVKDTFQCTNLYSGNTFSL